MVELQSCASLVNASSALCSIEQEVKAEGTVNIIAEMSAELQREREKIADFMERISVLEAQIQERDQDSSIAHGQVRCLRATDRNLKKFKRQKIGAIDHEFAEKNVADCETVLQIKHETQYDSPNDANVEDRLVNWMGIDETQFMLSDKLKDDDLAADVDDTDDSNEEEDFEEVDTHIDQKNGETYDRNNNRLDTNHYQNGVDERINVPCLGSFFGRECEPTFPNVNQKTNVDRKKFSTLPTEQANNKKNLPIKQDEKEIENNGICKTVPDDPFSKEEACNTGRGNISSVRKPPKMAFCPKEVKRILESETLVLKNAQSHTIRKITVFASLGIRHGCDDMYELDFNHFSILRKGEPYESPEDPGILEEEKAMHPSHPSCPSCLFLCIRYGGRTRNLPQNETDDDVEGEELCLPHSMNSDTASPSAQNLMAKAISTKLKGKKQGNSTNRSHSLPRSSVHQSVPSSTAPPTQFGLMGYTSIQTQTMASFKSIPCQVPNQVINSSGTNISYNNQTPHHIFQPQPANIFMPMIYWSAPNAFPPDPYASTYGYQTFPSSANFMSIHPQPFYSHPSCSSLITKIAERHQKNDSDSDNSSSSTETKDAMATCK